MIDANKSIRRVHKCKQKHKKSTQTQTREHRCKQKHNTNIKTNKNKKTNKKNKKTRSEDKDNKRIRQKEKEKQASRKFRTSNYACTFVCLLLQCLISREGKKKTSREKNKNSSKAPLRPATRAYRGSVVKRDQSDRDNSLFIRAG